MWIDSHAHLYADAFDKDRVEMVERARKEGVEAVILPNIDLDSIDQMFSLSHSEEGFLYPSVGLHPCSVREDYESQLSKMEPYLNREFVVAIGETGLDYYWDKSTAELQKRALRVQIEWALEYELPIILHARNSLDDLIGIISEYKNTGLQGVFHCFTGSVQQGLQIVDIGFYLGLGGILTFKNAGLDEVVQHLPQDRLLLETDAPYLSPTPHRGKRNESSYVALVGMKLAEVLNEEVERLAAITTANARKLFFSRE